MGRNALIWEKVHLCRHDQKLACRVVSVSDGRRRRGSTEPGDVTCQRCQETRYYKKLLGLVTPPPSRKRSDIIIRPRSLYAAEMKIIGQQVSRWLEYRQLTQRMLSRMSNVSVAQLIQLRRGELSTVHTVTLMRLADALDIDLVQLLYGSPGPVPGPIEVRPTGRRTEIPKYVNIYRYTGRRTHFPKGWDR